MDTAATVLSAAAGQAALDGWLAAHPEGPRAVIAEGLQALEVPANVTFTQLAAGCVCCIGQLPLKVALLRVLRRDRPRSLLLLVARAEHLSRVRALLADGTLGVKLRIE